METLIKTNHLCKKYGKQMVLDDVNIEVKKGDIYGFIGRNGAGKTTLMRILMGLSFQSSGDFKLLESNNLLATRQHISAVIESPTFYPNMTAEQNLKNHSLMLGIKPSKIDEALISVGLIEAKKKKVKNFSLGMKQRLAIAKALLNDSQLIILDEPTNGLDPEGIEDLRNLIKDLNQNKKVTFLISSHYLSELQSTATRYGFIEKGKICEEISSLTLERKLKKTLIIEVLEPNKAITLLKNEIHLDIENINLNLKQEKTGILQIKGNVDISKISALFYQNNIQINNIQNSQCSLEDYFFQVINHERG